MDIEIIKFLMTDQFSFCFPGKHRQTHTDKQVFKDGNIIFRRSPLDMCLSIDFTGINDGTLGKTGNFQKARKRGKINMKTSKRKEKLSFRYKFD
jgi:hypothetical protein